MEERPTCLKLEVAIGIHKTSDLPSTFPDLQQLLHGLYGSQEFHIRYTDDEGDLVTIASDSELQYAYLQTASKGTLRLELTRVEKPQEEKKIEAQVKSSTQEKKGESLFESLKKSVVSAFRKGKTELTKANLRRQFNAQLVRVEVSRMLGLPLPQQHDRTVCEQCKESPILGIRYKCVTCQNFSLCEVCEATTVHAHALLKLRTPELVSEPPSLASLLRGEVPPQAVLVAPQWDENFELTTGQQFLLSWLIRNPGTEQWPEGTKIVHVRGALYAPAAEVQRIPGEAEGEVAVFVTIPKAQGRVMSVFSLADKKGKRFGPELPATVSVASARDIDWEEKVATLESIGFTDRDAVIAVLEACEWDVNLAAEQLAS